jgi:hypothetical protein
MKGKYSLERTVIFPQTLEPSLRAGLVKGMMEFRHRKGIALTFERLAEFIEVTRLCAYNPHPTDIRGKAELSHVNT